MWVFWKILRKWIGFFGLVNWMKKDMVFCFLDLEIYIFVFLVNFIWNLWKGFFGLKVNRKMKGLFILRLVELSLEFKDSVKVGVRDRGYIC